MKIYTKTGDEGETSLIGGTRVPKYHLRIETFGTLDELNAHIGLVACQAVAKPYQFVLKQIQDNLFTIGAHLAVDSEKLPKKIPDLKPEDITLLEQEIDRIDELLPPLINFILPGGTVTVAYCHLARCVCRRAERLVVELASHSFVHKDTLIYLNRLSDYLFVLARKLNNDEGAEELLWNAKK